MNQYNEKTLNESFSIIDIANLCGYETYLFSNQDRYGIYDSPTSVLTDDAKNQVWTNYENLEYTNDYKIVNYLDDIECGGKKLLVIHLMGNHTTYSDRYPDEFNIFGEETSLDTYLNSILYNDYVVESIYEKLNKRSDFKAMIYVSDHSEDVIAGISHDSSQFTKNMVNIPFYVIFSDSYILNNEERINTLRNNSSEIITNDLIYDFVLGTMGIEINDCDISENDIGSISYNNSIERFTTLHGKVKIVDIK